MNYAIREEQILLCNPSCDSEHNNSGHNPSYESGQANLAFESNSEDLRRPNQVTRHAFDTEEYNKEKINLGSIHKLR